MTICQIIEQLRGTPGLNDKRQILRDNKDNEVFKRVLTLALDPRITFGIKKIPKYELSSDTHAEGITWGMNQLIPLHQRTYTGGTATDHLSVVLSKMNDDEAQIIKWIIAKDFKAGFGVSLINDEMKPFSVYEVPYMGAISYGEKKLDKLFNDHEEVISEVKMDGRYLNCIIKEGSVFFESRGGKPNPLMGALVEEGKRLQYHFGFDVVVNGELMLKGTTDRYKANGIIASYVSIAQKDYDDIDITKEKAKFAKKHFITLEEAKELIQFVVWDYIPYDKYLEQYWDMKRIHRLAHLKIALSSIDSFQLIEYKLVKNKAEAMEHFQKMLARDEEGTILKGSEGPWKDGKPNHQMKVKLDINLDLRITGFNYGTPGTKNENVISSLNVTSECGELNTSPGGIKEADMEFITENMDTLVGKLVEVNCKGLSKDSEDNWACLHPVFIKIRDDKEHGDTLENAKEIENMAKGLK